MFTNNQVTSLNDLAAFYPCEDILPDTSQIGVSLIRGVGSLPTTMATLEIPTNTCLPSTNCFEPSQREFVKIQIKDVGPEEDYQTLPEGQIEASSKPDFGDSYAKWRKLTLVAKSIQRFRSLRVERIHSEVNLRQVISDTPITKSASPNNKGIMYVTPGHIHSNALDSFRDQSFFFAALESATKRDLQYIKTMLANDPKANLYEEGSPSRLANKPNHRGYTPLYVACKNGNLELVKLLLEFKANPYQLSKVSSKEKESILLVAARWGHLDVLEYLTGPGFSWSNRELKKAYKETIGSQAKLCLKACIEKNKKPFLARLFACSKKEQQMPETHPKNTRI